MATSTSLRKLHPLNELRGEDLDAVFGGRRRYCGKQHFDKEHFGSQHFGNQQFGENIVQTNIAIEIAVSLGGNITQLIDQSNFV